MPPYTFYLHDGAPPPAFEMRNCRDDAEARAHAETLLDRCPECERIEVNGYQRDPFMVARPRLVGE
jgi:hypothetical protein